MKISKNVEVDVEMDAPELAKWVCGMWDDEQAQVLLEISKIVDEHDWKATHQLYAVGQRVYEAMTSEEQRKVHNFISMLHDFIVDFEGEKERDGEWQEK